MIFQFKQFAVAHDRCAMKIGTDGVLLGAWSHLSHNPETILDIGAGSGIIALMLSQRSFAPQIDALEIDEDAYEQCVDNFENSPWGDRLFCYHAGFDEFTSEIDDTYDLIVSNPPFFEVNLKNNENNPRNTARFQEALPFDELLEGTSLLLSSTGVFCVIIPYQEEVDFIQLAKTNGLHPIQITRVKGNANTPIKRSLLAFSKQVSEVVLFDELILETSRHQYTPKFKALVRDFYLKL